jgi:nucleoside 2-deoxyribosyltransferase
VSTTTWPVSQAIYIAGAFHRRGEFRNYAADLEAAGHLVVSRWLSETRELKSRAVASARRDIEDLRRSTCLIAILDPPRSTRTRGGHFHELGFFHALDRPIIICGSRTHVFTHLPEFHFFPDWPSCLASLAPSTAIQPRVKIAA